MPRTRYLSLSQASERWWGIELGAFPDPSYYLCLSNPVQHPIMSLLSPLGRCGICPSPFSYISWEECSLNTERPFTRESGEAHAALSPLTVSTQLSSDSLTGKKNHYLVILRGPTFQSAGYPKGPPKPYPLPAPLISILPLLHPPKPSLEATEQESPTNNSLGSPPASQALPAPAHTSISASMSPHSQLWHIPLNMALQLSPPLPRHATLLTSFLLRQVILWNRTQMPPVPWTSLWISRMNGSLL